MTRRIITWLCIGCALSTAAVGCATTQTERAHGLGVGQWEARLPTTASPIHELAYGRGGSSVAWDDSLADLGNVDALVNNEPAAVAQPKVKLAKSVIAPKRLASNAVQAKALSEPAPQEKIAEAAPAPQPQAAEPIVLAQNDAHDRYAGREQQAKQQQEFRGGDAVIVISAGALLVILLIVILILLLR